MLNNTFSIDLKDGDETKEFNLRLSIASQLKLKKQHNAEGVDYIMKAVSDLEMLVDFFTQALSFKDNKNATTNGEAFYELLVDNGYTGKEDFAKIVFEVSAASGIIKEEQSKKLSEMIATTYSSVFERMDELDPFESDKKEVKETVEPFRKD